VFIYKRYSRYSKKLVVYFTLGLIAILFTKTILVTVLISVHCLI